MATTNQDRANRRSSARRAAQQAPKQAAPQLIEDDLSEIEMDPESPVAAPQAPQTPMGGSRAQSANLSARRAALRTTAETTSGGSLARTASGEDLTRQLDIGDMVVPKIRISQAMSKTNTLFAQTRGREGIGMGSWYHTTGNKELGQTIYFVPVDMRKSRAMFAAGQGLICRSFDLLQGEGDPGILCEGTQEERLTVPRDQRGCAYRLWDRDKTPNAPPPCGVTYNYPGLVIVDIDNPEKSPLLQGMLQLRSSSTGAAKEMNTVVMTEAGGIWHDTIFELTIEPKTNAKGTFFVPVAKLHDRTDEPEYARILKRAEGFARSMNVKDLRSSIEQDSETDGPF